MNISVFALNENDRAEWAQLYHEYADFYQMPMNDEILDTVWSWIFDDSNPFFGFIAKQESGKAVGIMHCRTMPSPLRGAVVGFLDDLYVCPESRGTGCVQRMYKVLKQFGKDQGWPFIRWITAEDNYRGRASYDKIAQKTHWLTYQMPVD